MGNLVLNAYESIQRRNETEGEITFSASEDMLDDKPMIRVTIRDNVVTCLVAAHVSEKRVRSGSPFAVSHVEAAPLRPPE